MKPVTWLENSPEIKGVQIRNGHLWCGSVKVCMSEYIVSLVNLPPRARSVHLSLNLRLGAFSVASTRESVSAVYKSWYKDHLGPKARQRIQYFLIQSFLTREESSKEEYLNRKTWFESVNAFDLLPKAAIKNLFNCNNKTFLCAYNILSNRHRAYTESVIIRHRQTHTYLNTHKSIWGAFMSARADAYNFILSRHEPLAKVSRFVRRHPFIHNELHRTGLTVEEASKLSLERLEEELTSAQKGNLIRFNTPLTEPIEAEEVKIIPLTTSHDMFEEGRDMRHCVHSYSKDRRTIEGEYLFFHLEGKEQEATLQLSNEEEISVVQLFSKCNTEVTDKSILKGVDYLIDMLSNNSY